MKNYLKLFLLLLLIAQACKKPNTCKTEEENLKSAQGTEAAAKTNYENAVTGEATAATNTRGALKNAIKGPTDIESSFWSVFNGFGGADAKNLPDTIKFSIQVFNTVKNPDGTYSVNDETITVFINEAGEYEIAQGNVSKKADEYEDAKKNTQAMQKDLTDCQNSN